MIRGHPRDAYRTFAAFTAFGTLWGGWAALVPQVQQDVGASKGALGLALLAVGAGSVPAMLLVGPAVNRRGPRVLPPLLLALALAAILPGLAGSVWTLAATLLAVGAASGAVDVAINAAASEVEARTGDRIMQLAHGLFSLGVLAGAVAVGVSRQAGAGRLPILGGLAAGLALAALANRGRPGSVARSGGVPRFRVRRHVVLLGLACGGAFLVEGGIENWSAIFMERDLGASPLQSALGPSSYALAMVAGRFSGQWLTGRISDRRLLGGGALLSLAGLLVAASAPAVPVAVAGFFLGGAGVSVAAPVAFGAAGRGVPAGERGSAVATVTTIGYLGFLLGPPITGSTAELLGLRASFVVLAVAALAVAAAVPRLPLGEDGLSAPRDRAARAGGEAA